MNTEEMANKIRSAASLLDEIRRDTNCPNSVSGELSLLATKLDSLSIKVQFPS
jgi:uncharacterized protein (UPF0147 family)